MPFLEGEETAGSAGIDTVSKKKPSSEKLIIRSITVYSAVSATDFAAGYARLEKTGKTSHVIPFGMRYCQNPKTESLRWDLNTEWPDAWHLEIGYYAQAAGIWYWTIEYDVIEVKEKRKRWGE